MASDRQQFAAALAKWRELGMAGELSVPVWQGSTAVITSGFTDEDPGTQGGALELASFRSEALALADKLRTLGHVPEVIIDATRHDIDRLVADPHVVSVYVIGNGSLSTLLLDVGTYFDWTDVATASTHRKLGIFVQRQCGGLTRSLNVPLGLFAVDDPTRVFAAVGEAEFSPRDLDDPENAKVRNVLDTRELRYETFKDANVVEAGRSLPGAPAKVACPGNFHRRLVEARAIMDERASADEVRYVRMVKERFGVDLLAFYSQHAELCDSIVDSVRASARGTPTGDRRLVAEAYGLIEQTTLNAPFLAR